MYIFNLVNPCVIFKDFICIRKHRIVEAIIQKLTLALYIKYSIAEFMAIDPITHFR